MYLKTHPSHGIGRYGNKSGTNLTTKLPPNVKSLTLEDFRIDTFPNLVNYTNLESLELDNINMDNDIIANLTDIIPLQLKSITLDVNNPNFDYFPNFLSFDQLQYISFSGIGVIHKSSFVSTTFPSRLQRIYIDDMELQGILNFTRLISQYSYNHSNTSIIDTSNVKLSYVRFYQVAFTSVDFRGIGDYTDVTLSSEIVCAAESVYPDRDTSDYICTVRSQAYCIGEKACIETCQCFRLPDDWQPSLNDFYTYVIYRIIYMNFV